MQSLDALLAAREKIARRSAGDILAALDGVIERWLAADSPWRLAAEEALAQETGFAAAMLRECLPRQLAPLRGDAIGRLLDEELGQREASGPRLLVQVLPGNVPALAAPAICLALAVKAAVLVKPGRDERAFAPLFAASIAALDPDLGACVAVHYWRGGAGEIEDEIFRRADAVEVSGGDAAVDAIRPRVRGRFLGRGARVSFAALSREVIAGGAALAAAARGIAADISIWDQRGCLSPQVVFAETSSPDEIERVAEALAASLGEYARRWAPRSLSLDEKAAVLRFRQAAEWSLGGSEARLICATDLAWTIALEPRAALRPTCLHRSVRLQPIADLAHLAGVIAPMQQWLEAAGVAADPPRYAALARQLRAAGVHRICAAGEMQNPDLTWKPGGLPRISWAMPGDADA